VVRLLPDFIRTSSSPVQQAAALKLARALCENEVGG
jgi:hypothetical protein